MAPLKVMEGQPEKVPRNKPRESVFRVRPDQRWALATTNKLHLSWNDLARSTSRVVELMIRSAGYVLHHVGMNR